MFVVVNVRICDLYINDGCLYVKVFNYVGYCCVDFDVKILKGINVCVVIGMYIVNVIFGIVVSDMEVIIIFLDVGICFCYGGLNFKFNYFSGEFVDEVLFKMVELCEGWMLVIICKGLDLISGFEIM